MRTWAAHKSRVRNGAGLEYRRGSIEASTGLHQSTGPSGRFSASANVAWLPSDGWRLAANFDSDSNDLPWKAYRAGIHGWSSGVSARYQPTERTYYDVAYQLQRYSDSNTRQTIGATWFQNLWTVPRHSVSTWTSVAYSNNNKTDTEYFSPDHDLTAQVTAMYEWRPWRDGQYAFRQRVYATGGSTTRPNMATAPCGSCAWNRSGTCRARPASPMAWATAATAMTATRRTAPCSI